MYNKQEKLEKYIILGRTSTIHNLDGEDRRKVISEIYIRKPHSGVDGMFVEYNKYMYNEIHGGRGRDINMESGQTIITMDGTVESLIDINFANSDLETNDIRFVKTYPNKKFLNRDRATSAHKVVDVAVDGNGNGFIKSDDD